MVDGVDTGKGKDRQMEQEERHERNNECMSDGYSFLFVHPTQYRILTGATVLRRAFYPVVAPQ